MSLLDLDQREAIASAWTRQGIDYLNQPRGTALSIPWFEAAIQLRTRFPLDQNRWYRYGLAAGWMNRGAALSKLGGDQNLEESIQCFDSALEQLKHLPVEERPEFRQRHIIAWTNRGLSLLQQIKNPVGALHSFQRAHSLLNPDLPEFPVLKIGIETNLATAQFQIDGNKFQAETNARSILASTEPYESTHLPLAEVSLKARHLLCLTVGYQADSRRHTLRMSSNRISEVTDILEKGIRLALTWTSQGNRDLLPLAQTLFCFGFQFYRAYLPQFLVEFIAEFFKEDSTLIPSSPALILLIHESLKIAEFSLYQQTSKKIQTTQNVSSTESLMERYHDLVLLRKQYDEKIKSNL